jgi:outer membrane protein TolC
LLKAQDRVELWDVEVEKAKNDYEKAEKMYEYGNTAKLDLLESKNYYMYAKHNLKVEKNNYNLRKIEFEEYLNKEIDVIEEYEFPELTIKNLESYMDFAENNSYEYENLVLNYKANKYNYWSYKMEKLPQVNFFLEKNYTDKEFDSYENDALTYGVSVDLSGWLYSSVNADYSYSEYDDIISNLPEASNDEVYSLTMNILNGDYTTSSVLQKKISYLRSKKRIENEKRALEKLIKTAYYNLVDAKSYYEMQKMNLEAKQELRRKRMKEYELGIIDSSERFDAIKQYLQAEIDYIDAKYNYYISWYNLLKVVGKEIEI